MIRPERCLVSCLLNVRTSESDRRRIEYAARDAQHTEDIPLVSPSIPLFIALASLAVTQPINTPFILNFKFMPAPNPPANTVVGTSLAFGLPIASAVLREGWVLKKRRKKMQGSATPFLCPHLHAHPQALRAATSLFISRESSPMRLIVTSQSGTRCPFTTLPFPPPQAAKIST